MKNPFAFLTRRKLSRAMYDAVVTEVADEPGGLTRVRLEYLPERGKSDGFTYGRRDFSRGHEQRIMEVFLHSDVGRKVCLGDRMSAAFEWQAPE